MISVLVPAYNEGRSISSTLFSICQQVPPDHTEVIVVASGCTDRTADIVRKYQARYRNIVLRVERERRGKASALRIAREVARGEIFVLTDADVLWGATTFSHLITPFEHHGIGIVCGRVQPRQRIGNVAVRLGIERCNVWHKVRVIESAQQNLTIPSGYLYAIRSEIFPIIPDGIVADDAYVGVVASDSGCRIVYEPKAIVRPRYPDNLSDYLEQRIRGNIGRLQLRSIAEAEISRVHKSLVAHSLEGVVTPMEASRWLAALQSLLDIVCRSIARNRVRAVGARPYAVWKPIPSTKRGAG